MLELDAAVEEVDEEEDTEAEVEAEVEEEADEEADEIVAELLNAAVVEVEELVIEDLEMVEVDIVVPATAAAGVTAP